MPLTAIVMCKPVPLGKNLLVQRQLSQRFVLKLREDVRASEARESMRVSKHHEDPIASEGHMP